MVDAAAEAVFLALAAAFGLALVFVVAGDVEADVQEPAGELLADEVTGGHDGSFFHELGKLVG